jgi:single-strand DNA-binding protein
VFTTVILSIYGFSLLPSWGKYFPHRGSVFSRGFFNLIGENTMSYLNKVMLIGNLGRDPEVLKSTDKSCFARLSLATKKRYINSKGQTVEESQWHTVYVSNGTGKYIASYAKKGAKLYAEGELITQSWEDKTTGKPRYATSVFAHVCRIVHQKQDELASDGENAPAEGGSAYELAKQQISEMLPGTFQENEQHC